MKKNKLIFCSLFVLLLNACGSSASSPPPLMNEAQVINPNSQISPPLEQNPTPLLSTLNPVTSPTPAPSATPNPTPIPLPSIAANLQIPVDQDLRKFDSPVVHQFGGTCSTFAAAAAINNVLHSKGFDKEVSEQHLWSTYRTFNYNDAIVAASKNYLTEENYWTIEGVQDADYLKHADIRITEFQDYQDNMNEALKGLASGRPLVMAFQLPLDVTLCESMIRPNSARGRGGHVVEVVGYHLDDKISGGGYLILKNSWGPDCGDKGYHYYPISLCARGDLYCYFMGVSDVEVKLAPTP